MACERSPPALAFDAAMSQEARKRSGAVGEAEQPAVVKLAAAAACVFRVGK